MYEIELKYQLHEPDRLRRALVAVGTHRAHYVAERNQMFDYADARLRRSGGGLRLRVTHDMGETAALLHAHPAQHATLAYKGPRLAGATAKQREEIEVALHPPERALLLLARLGLALTLEFDKRRETWPYGACEVVIDELPRFGWFAEVEGPSEAAVRQVAAQLELPDTDRRDESYAEMIALHGRRDADGVVRCLFA